MDFLPAGEIFCRQSGFSAGRVDFLTAGWIFCRQGASSAGMVDFTDPCCGQYRSLLNISVRKNEAEFSGQSADRPIHIHFDSVFNEEH